MAPILILPIVIANQTECTFKKQMQFHPNLGTNAISPELCVTYFLQKSVLVEQTETKVPTGDYHLLQNVQKISYKLIT
jgi:hypothetical protein